MPNQFGLNGANPGKNTRQAPIYTGRWSSGIWTNRSPLRDAATSRITEKFYGAAGDALIAGSNVEITNRLTLGRRPGNSVYPPNQGSLTPHFSNVDRFYDFRVFDSASEEIWLMVDTATSLRALGPGSVIPQTVWVKDPKAGQSYMQSVGNTLYWGDGVDNKKWLQSLVTWTKDTFWNTATTPYLSTFLIDTHGNIQQLTGTAIPIAYVYVQDNTVEIISNIDIASTLTAGTQVTFPAGMTASFLDGLTVTVTVVGTEPFGNAFFFNLITPDYGQTPELNKFATVYPGDGQPISGTTVPNWNTTVPSASNFFQGGTTNDGSVVWTNRGNPVENWGIAPPTSLVSPVVLNGAEAWAASTVYSNVQVVIDTNGNLQQLVQAGTSGSTVVWNVFLGSKTYDGAPTTQVIWDLIASPAMMNWKANTIYPAGSFLIANGCLFEVAITAIGPGGGTSGPTVPIWPNWTTVDAPAYPQAVESTGLTWNNLGPITDFVWHSSSVFKGVNVGIVDPNGYEQRPYETGKSGTSIPSFSSGLDTITADNPNLVWINQGKSQLNPAGLITTSNGGWRYSISLVNTLDDTVSNATPMSATTGNFTGAVAVLIPPGSGLPPVSQIDSQADYVAIWRTTDGGAQPFLVPGPNDFSLPITLPLWQYLAFGYEDTTPDTGLNNLIEAPILGENTPPAKGASSLAYYQQRLFYRVGNTVSWTSGPDTPAGNGFNGSAPLNFDEQQSLVNRIVPTTSGAMIFTVSDINLITSTTTSTGTTINPAIPLVEGIGLASYNALDTNGSIIGFFSTDSQFLIIDPANGFSSAGFPIGDQLRLNNGTPGQSWVPSKAYVAWHVNGEDQGWYLADGANGWYRLMATPAPETGGYTWSPFATIQGGVKAVQSVETSPGIHNLLLGPAGTANSFILARNLDYFMDGTVSYAANATLGSMVLAQPGQYAFVSFITTESVKVGTPLVAGVLVDDAYPYYQGPFDVLKNWTLDPPILRPSRSILGQRFWFSELENDAAMCRHMQVQLTWASEAYANELLTFTVFGGYSQAE